jgi:hypothetical protein
LKELQTSNGIIQCHQTSPDYSGLRPSFPTTSAAGVEFTLAPPPVAPGKTNLLRPKRATDYSPRVSPGRELGGPLTVDLPITLYLNGLGLRQEVSEACRGDCSGLKARPAFVKDWVMAFSFFRRIAHPA